MAIHVLNQTESIIGNYLSQIRDQDIQKDRLRFRTNIHRIGTILAYEASKHMRGYGLRDVQTPLAQATEIVLVNQPVIETVMRAGLGIHGAFLDVFDEADSGFLGAARVEGAEKHLVDKPDVVLGYKASPSLAGRTLVWTEVMIASGESLNMAHNSLLSTHGTPDQTIVCGVIGAREGIDYVMDTIKPDHLIVASVDRALNDVFYIVPGLGDAGDLQFGNKL
jgi:uracil phosphoribosyltransferase